MRVREVLATFEKYKDLILTGQYRKGQDRRIDYALEYWDRVQVFLKQATDEKTCAQGSIERLIALFGSK